MTFKVFLLSLIYGFLGICVAVQFFPEKKWTWNLAGAVMLVYTFVEFHFRIVPMIIIQNVIIVLIALYLLIQKLIKKLR